MGERPMSLLLRWLGVAIYRLGLHRPLIWLNRRTPRVLAYHACDEIESEFTAGLNINTPPTTLAAQLDFLASCYRVVPLDALERGNYPERAVVITFDDGFRSVRENAFPQLVARRFPATVYVVAATMANDHLVWVNELNWFFRRHESRANRLASAQFGLPNGTSAAALMRFAQADASPEQIETLLQRLGEACGVDRHELARAARMHLTRDDTADMAQHRITFGNHTATHANLARCSEDRLRQELAAASGLDVPALQPSLAYPFGRFTDRTRSVALALGHKTIMHIGGANRPLDVSRVARTPVSTESPAELFAQMEVVQPIKQLLTRVLGRHPYGYTGDIHGDV